MNQVWEEPGRVSCRPVEMMHLKPCRALALRSLFLCEVGGVGSPGMRNTVPGAASRPLALLNTSRRHRQALCRAYEWIPQEAQGERERP